MSELQKALDGYIEANNQLIEASSFLDERNILTPDISKQVHVCLCSDEQWENIVKVAGNDVKLVERGDSAYPYQQEVMYGDYTIFRLLEVAKNE